MMMPCWDADHLEKKCQAVGECDQITDRVTRDLHRRRRVEVGFLDTDKVYRMERDKVEKFSAFGSMTCPLKNPVLARRGSGS